MTTYNNLISGLEKARNILIISHVNPDGDTLGASVAMFLALSKKYSDKEIIVTALNSIPELYEFVPSIEKITPIENLVPDKIFDIAIAVDVASKDRMTKALNFFEQAKMTVNIDHHKTNNEYGNINFVEPNASSASEVVFKLLKNCNFEIDEAVADCLYTGIMTDTGSFRYENTSEHTFEIASELIALGANPCKISKAYYDCRPKAMVSLHAYAVCNATFLFNDKVAYTYVTKEAFEKCHAKDEHTDGIAELLRQIKTVELAFVLKETSMGHTKISMRSKSIDCAKLCEKYDGGGHAHAAGCTIKKPPQIALDKLLEDIKVYYEN